MFSAKRYERTLLDELNAGHRHELVYVDPRLEPGTVSLAAGSRSSASSSTMSTVRPWLARRHARPLRQQVLGHNHARSATFSVVMFVI
jgi:D-lactate dehydrogenase